MQRPWVWRQLAVHPGCWMQTTHLTLAKKTRRTQRFAPRLAGMALNVGDKAPTFILTSHLGEEISLSEELKKKPVALVFFPLAASGICTGELCELQENLSLFEDKNVQLIGVSVDSKFALKAWAAEQGYTFPLLADFWPHGAVAQDFDVFVEESGYANRATFLIGQDGVIRASFVTAPGEARDLDEYRRALDNLSTS